MSNIKSNIKVEKITHLRGEICLPGDKSISHRAIMISSIARGKSFISNLLSSLDCYATIDAFKRMGISIEVGDLSALVGGSRGKVRSGSPLCL